MGDQINFGAVVSALNGTGLTGNELPAFNVEKPAGFFVNPELIVKENLRSLSSDVILVSARGAAGKSTAAAELSRRIGAPLWRLEKDKAVSGTSLGFTLSQYLGVTNVDSARRLSLTPWTRRALGSLAHRGQSFSNLWRP
jgi:hypothetical protein